MGREHDASEQAGKHSAQWHADDGCRHRQCSVAQRRELRCRRRRGWQGSADAKSRDEAKGSDGQEIRRKADRAGRGAEHEDTANHRPAAAEAIREQASTCAADRHTDQAGSNHRRERPSRDAPFLDDHGNRKSDQLSVEPVQHDRQRGQEDRDLLERREGTLVEQLADVDCIRRAWTRETHDLSPSVQNG
jgi:hypothetical protein